MYTNYSSIVHYLVPECPSAPYLLLPNSIISRITECQKLRTECKMSRLRRLCPSQMSIERIKCCDINEVLFGNLPRMPRSTMLEKAKSTDGAFSFRLHQERDNPGKRKIGDSEITVNSDTVILGGCILLVGSQNKSIITFSSLALSIPSQS